MQDLRDQGLSLGHGSESAELATGPSGNSPLADSNVRSELRTVHRQSIQSPVFQALGFPPDFQPSFPPPHLSHPLPGSDPTACHHYQPRLTIPISSVPLSQPHLLSSQLLFTLVSSPQQSFGSREALIYSPYCFYTHAHTHKHTLALISPFLLFFLFLFSLWLNIHT